MIETAPNLRLARLLEEGGRFKAELPDQQSIDVTPDVIAALARVQTPPDGFEPMKESIDPQ